MALSDLVGDIKTGSTNHINENHWVKGRFSWQEGFGAFSDPHSQLTDVIRYIENQVEHHRQRGFREEYLEFLEGSRCPTRNDTCSSRSNSHKSGHAASLGLECWDVLL